jgi:hypothetical protein
VVSTLADWLNEPAVGAPPAQLLPEYVFRYMGPGGLDATISSGGLRMNVWSKMNDPREAKVWKSTGILTATPPYTKAEMEQRLDDVLRRSARLMSLSVDRDQMPDAARDSLFHRGWGKAPLWANYASAHQGVCLVLDFPAVCEALDSMPVRTVRYRNWGRINYVDKLIRLDVTGTFANQAELDAEVYTFLEQRYCMSALHMTKATDWAYETELRLAVIDRDLTDLELDTPINLPLGECVSAVIFGDAYCAPERKADEIRVALGARSPEFFQCHWSDGAPELEQLAV